MLGDALVWVMRIKEMIRMIFSFLVRQLPEWWLMLCMRLGPQKGSITWRWPGGLRRKHESATEQLGLQLSLRLFKEKSNRELPWWREGQEQGGEERRYGHGGLAGLCKP